MKSSHCIGWAKDDKFIKHACFLSNSSLSSVIYFRFALPTFNL